MKPSLPLCAKKEEREREREKIDSWPPAFPSPSPICLRNTCTTKYANCCSGKFGRDLSKIYKTCSIFFFGTCCSTRLPDGTFQTYSNYRHDKFTRKMCVTFVWCSDDMFRHMFKADFATLVSLKVPSGKIPTKQLINKFQLSSEKSAPSFFFIAKVIAKTYARCIFILSFHFASNPCWLGCYTQKNSSEIPVGKQSAQSILHYS